MKELSEDGVKEIVGRMLNEYTELMARAIAEAISQNNVKIIENLKELRVIK